MMDNLKIPVNRMCLMSNSYSTADFVSDNSAEN